MSDTKDGSSELPVIREVSIRDYFAAKAMQAILSRDDIDIPRLFMLLDEEKDVIDVIATASFKAAHAMLEARKQ